MSAPNSSLTRFVRAVHRRQVFLRIVEGAGIGLLVGCVFGTALAALLLWRGREAWSVAGAVLAAGMLIGAVWGMARRPTALFSAAEADRQLQTADLLGTAWTLRQEAAVDDPWRRTVLAVAAAQCQRLSPSTVLLRRLGVRAWGGIALAVAFVGTLAALSSTSLEARLTDSRGVVARSTPSQRKPIVEIALNAERIQRRMEQSPVSEGGRQPGDPGEIPTPGPDEAAAENPDDGRPSTPGIGAGAASGQGKTNPPNRPRESPVFTPSRISVTRPSASTQIAGGVGRPERNALQSEFGSGEVVEDDTSAPLAPPWSQDSWTDVVEAAREAVDSGRVSDNYRDLVRIYFDAAERPAQSGQQ